MWTAFDEHLHAWVVFSVCDACCCSVCDPCCWWLYFRLLSTRSLVFTVASFVFHVTVEPQTEEEQYEVAEHNYEEEQDQGQYSEQGKPPHQYNESHYFYQAYFVSK